MGRPESIVVVGASAAGLAVVESVRREGFEGSVLLIGSERHLPYDRPELSKKVLTGAWMPEQVRFRESAFFDEQGVEVVLGVRAVSLDVERRQVGLSDGTKVPYGALAVTTGLTARTIDAFEDREGVFVLRTVDDALQLREALVGAGSVAVVGAGVLGCEIASSARRMGLDVSLIDSQEAPMSRTTGTALGGLLSGLHRDQGVSLKMHSTVKRMVGDQRLEGVELDSGELIECDLLVVAIGGSPATDWLAGSGLAVDDGVLSDATLQAGPDVYTAGDVARWVHPLLGTSTRLEHRMNATEQGRVVGRNLLGAREEYAPIPYFWTDQYESRIQGYGWFAPDSVVSLTEEDAAKGRFLMQFRAGDRVTGIIGWNCPVGFRKARSIVDESFAMEVAG